MYIRNAQPTDGADLLTIYAPFVTNTTVTLETEVPTIADFTQRIVDTLPDYPYLVACADNGDILGYAYAHRYKERLGYNWTVETSIYVGHSGHGVGQALYHALFELLTQQHVQTVMACVTGNNQRSLNFHERLGFIEVGHFEKVGYKLGEWVDIHWFERRLSDGAPQAFIPFHQLPQHPQAHTA
ncbi:GNAT family N-acetyltransferase [Lacticaseibacillus porcinae]|uniref:GNAT family N-acetyltransferase n=1 Tax=Lacticaseibacillus porcinae TaxID=1123687 RepID=UPI000F78CFD8|nr:GNAT family N-acetyltransferase [Lacticaseibacillus porcinae]